jgi:hypothetical protein
MVIWIAKKAAITLMSHLFALDFNGFWSTDTALNLSYFAYFCCE